MKLNYNAMIVYMVKTRDQQTV